MNALQKINKWAKVALVVSVCFVTFGAHSQTSTKKETPSFGLKENLTEVHDDGEMVLTVLADEVHTLKAVLKSKSAVHYYSFTSFRGQSVLLSSEDSTGRPVFWDVELYDGARWVKQLASKRIFSGLSPKTELLIRVVHKDDVPFLARP